MLPTDLRVREVRHDFQEFLYRTPIKFGGVAVDRATLLDVQVVVQSRAGQTATGTGSMPLGNVWAFPSRKLTYDQTLQAMKLLAGRIAAITAACTESAHPIELNHVLEPEYVRAAREVERELALAEPIPLLGTLVVASPFDAAIHDALGKMLGRSSYDTLGPELLPSDLARYLGPDFAGEYLDHYVRKVPTPRLPLYHLVGALDPLTEADLRQRIGDGLPETLPEWIVHNGLTHLKIKLNGEDLAWDVERVVAVDRVAAETQVKRGVTTWYYSLDFNERCPHVQYLLDFLQQLRERTPAGFARVQYIEQPTARDLKANRHNVMHQASRLRPVVIDESLVDRESLELAREMGYTGAALKTCKGQSASLLLAAAAQKMGLFLCVQDLTCPGLSLLRSAGLAAHIPGVAAIEANSRQYVPAANAGWDEKYPGIFKVTDGTMDTSILTGPGLFP